MASSAASSEINQRGIVGIAKAVFEYRPSFTLTGFGVFVGVLLLGVWVSIARFLDLGVGLFIGLTVIGICLMRMWAWMTFDATDEQIGTEAPAIWVVGLAAVVTAAVTVMVVAAEMSSGVSDTTTPLGHAIAAAILISIALTVRAFTDLHCQDVLANGADPVRFAIDIIARVPVAVYLTAMLQQSLGPLSGFTSHPLNAMIGPMNGWTWLLFVTPAVMGLYAAVQLGRQANGVASLVPPRIYLRKSPDGRMVEFGAEQIDSLITSEESGSESPQLRHERMDMGSVEPDRETAGHVSESDDTSDDEDEEDEDVVEESESAPEVTFDDVAGMEDVKEQLEEEVITPFSNPEYEQYDIGAVTGVLLYGPPGTGKTYLARAVAGELGCKFLNVNTSDIVSDVVGRSVQNLKDVFNEAYKEQPSVVFLDEIDAIAPERGGQNMSQSQQQVVNTLLTALSEMDEDDDVLVIAATNRPDELDEALKRAGRFDTTIKVGMPDRETRLAILEYELDNSSIDVEPVWTDADFMDEFAAETSNMAASDISRIVEGAKRSAVASDDDEPTVTRTDIWDAVEQVAEKRTEDTASEYLAEQPDVAFDDVGGMDDLKQTLEEKIIDPLENPEKYEEYGLSPTNGVLLYGPPGTGKTYMARALAGEAGLTFLSISGSDVVSKWVGEAADNVQDLFNRAVEVQPCILFIDEIDAIAPDRSGQNMSQSQQQMVNELLNGLSDIKGEEVVVIATTNKPDEIDSAVKRAGRMDEQVEVPPPDVEARAEILRVQLENRPTADDINWEALAEMADGQGGRPLVAADLEQAADEAARRALEDSAEDEVAPIQQSHLEAAIRGTESSLNS